MHSTDFPRGLGLINAPCKRKLNVELTRTLTHVKAKLEPQTALTE
jgi:hypothetical protein